MILAFQARTSGFDPRHSLAMIKSIIAGLFIVLSVAGGVAVQIAVAPTATAVPSSNVIHYATWTCPLCGQTYEIDPEDNLVEMHLMFAHPEWWKSHFGDGTND